MSYLTTGMNRKITFYCFYLFFFYEENESFYRMIIKEWARPLIILSNEKNIYKIILYKITSHEIILMIIKILNIYLKLIILMCEDNWISGV